MRFYLCTQKPRAGERLKPQTAQAQDSAVSRHGPGQGQNVCPNRTPCQAGVCLYNGSSTGVVTDRSWGRFLDAPGGNRFCPARRNHPPARHLHPNVRASRRHHRTARTPLTARPHGVTAQPHAREWAWLRLAVDSASLSVRKAAPLRGRGQTRISSVI